MTANDENRSARHRLQSVFAEEEGELRLAPLALRTRTAVGVDFSARRSTI